MPRQQQQQAVKPIYDKPWFWVLAVLVIIAFIGFWIWGIYNSLVTLNVNVDNKWAQVQVQLQRRYDLIPNYVNTVSAYMKFENATLVQVTQLRSQWAAATTPEQQVQASNQLEAVLSKLIVDVEAYPNLQSITALQNLQFELAGTENRIAVARGDYNNAVQSYNTAIKLFPTNVIAGYLGFTSRTFFNATTTAQTTIPTVPSTLT